MSILIGSEQTIYGGGARGAVVVPIDDSTCAILYQRDDANKTVYLLSATRNGLVLDFGSETQVEDQGYVNRDFFSQLGMCQYDTDKVCYKYNDNRVGTYLGNLGLASISGKTVTLGDTTEYNSASATDLAGDPVTLTSGSRIFSSHQHGSWVTNVSGTTIVSQTSRNITASGDSHMYNSIGVCDSERVLIFHRVSTAYGSTQNVTVVGDTITNKTKSNFVDNPVDPYHLDVTPLHSSGEFVVTWSSNSDGAKGQIVHVAQSGDTAVYGTPQTWNTGSIKGVSAITYGDNHVDLIYIDNSDSDKIKIVQGTVDGTVFSFPDSPIVLHDGGSWFTHKAQMFDDKYCVIAYRDDDDGNYQKSLVVNVAPWTEVSESCELFIQGRDSRYCLHHENVVFYHPCDDHTETTAGHAWSGAATAFAPGLIVSGIQLVDGETFLSCHHDYHCRYPQMDGATSFAMAFWSSGLFAVGPDADVFIGNSSSPTEVADENGIFFHGNTGKPMIHIDGDMGQAIGSLIPTPTDSDWHFVTLYAEISGGNWQIYGSLDGGALDHLTDDNSSTAPMSDQPYLTIHVDDPVSSSPEPVIDEVICWIGLDAPFTPDEVLNMYDMGYAHANPLNAYRDHYVSCGSTSLFIMGPQQITASGDLCTLGRNAGYLCPEDVIFYLPCDTIPAEELVEDKLWTDYGGHAGWPAPPSFVMSSGIVASGFVPDISKTSASFVLAHSGGYTDIADSSGLCMAFWVTGNNPNGTTRMSMGFGNAANEILDNGIEYSHTPNATNTYLYASGQVYGGFHPTLPTLTDPSFIVVDMRCSGGTTWVFRESVNGGDWTVSTTMLVGPAKIFTNSTYAKVVWWDNWIGNVLDEAILWSNNPLFTAKELSNLYELGSTHVDPMSSYFDHYGISAVDSCNMFIHGLDTMQASGDMFIDGSEGTIALDSCDLFVAGIQATGYLYAEDVIFYLPCDTIPVEELVEGKVWTDYGSWGIGVPPSSPPSVTLASGVVGSGIENIEANNYSYYVGHSGSYPNISGMSNLCIAFWISSTESTEMRVQFSETPYSAGLPHNGLIGSFNNGEIRHFDWFVGTTGAPLAWVSSPSGAAFYVFDLRFSGGTTWLQRISIDGGDWSSPVAATLPSSFTNNPVVSVSATSTNSSFTRNDEIIMWGDNPLFNAKELSNLYELGKTSVEPMPSYFSYYGISAVDSCNMFIHGLDTMQASGDMFIDGSEGTIALDSCDLFVGGQDVASGTCDLFSKAYESILGSGDLYTIASIQESDTCNLYIHGGRNVWLYTAGYDVVESSGDLFTQGHTPLQASGNLFIRGYGWLPDSGDMFIDGHDTIGASGDLYLYGHNTHNDSHDLFIHGVLPFSASGDLVITGHGLPSASCDLFTFTSHETITDSMLLFINGLEPKPALACPLLDPTAAIQIKASLIETYQDLIDDVIDQLGKNVLLEFDPIRAACPNCEFDLMRKRSTGVYKIGGPRPFKRGRKCPYCKGRGLVETAVTSTIKCLTKWNPVDAKNYGVAISQASDIVRLKTYLTDADDLMRAKTIVVNHDIVDQMRMRVRMIQGPIPVGLREDRYCISFWELI